MTNGEAAPVAEAPAPAEEVVPAEASAVEATPEIAEAPTEVEETPGAGAPSVEDGDEAKDA